jgi:uncharacterized protein YbjT (DUF2867 family)
LASVEVLVTGGTGVLGRRVVARLRERGHRAVVLSRRRGKGSDWRQGDLATGAGLSEAVAGMGAIVHAGSATTQLNRMTAVDVEGTRRMEEAARAGGVGHLVLVSIVGMEGIRYPYYRAKLGAEAAVEAGRTPWTILRATQFHSLVEFFLGAFSILPGLVVLPAGWRLQPVDPDEVAARLVEVVEAPPAGRLPDFGGPEVRELRGLAESWLRARRSRRAIVSLPLPLQASREVAAGRLCCPDHRDGEVTFEQYLETRYQGFKAGP